MGGRYTESGRPARKRELRGAASGYVGVSKGPGADLGRAIQQAAKAAAADGHVGVPFDLRVEIEPEKHNQWVRTYRVVATGP
jgi:hypothetical protein